MRLVGSKEVTLRGIAFLGWLAHKRDALAVEGPDKAAVGIHRRCDERNGFRCGIVDGDEAVIVARGNESELAAVRRPARLKILAAHDKLLRLLGGVQRRKPDLAILDVSDGPARRNVRRMASINALGIAARRCDGPDSLLGARGITGGIGHLTGGVLTSTADVHKSIGVRRKAQGGEFLAVVFVIFCELPRGKAGRFGHPNVPLALLIEDPGYAIAVPCHSQV